MKTPTDTRRILDALEAQHPGADTELHYSNAVRAARRRRSSRRSPPTSASTWSRRRCSGAIRTRARSPRATPAELEPQIHSTGFFRAKSKALIGMAQALVERARRRGAGRHGRAGRRCRASAARPRTSCSATRSACPACRSIGTCCASRTASASPNRDDPERRRAAAVRGAAAGAVDARLRHADPARPADLQAEAALRPVRRAQDDCDYYADASPSAAGATRRRAARTGTRAPDRATRTEFERNSSLTRSRVDSRAASATRCRTSPSSSRTSRRATCCDEMESSRPTRCSASIRARR